MENIELVKEFLRSQLGPNNSDLKIIEHIVETYDGRYRMYEPITRQVFFSKETPKVIALECTVFLNINLLNDRIVSIFDYVDNLRKISGDENLKLRPWMHRGGWCLDDDCYDYNAGYSSDGRAVRVFAERRDLDGIGVVKALNMLTAPVDFALDEPAT